MRVLLIIGAVGVVGLALAGLGAWLAAQPNGHNGEDGANIGAGIIALFGWAIAGVSLLLIVWPLWSLVRARREMRRTSRPG